MTMFPGIPVSEIVRRLGCTALLWSAVAPGLAAQTQAPPPQPVARHVASGANPMQVVLDHIRAFNRHDLNAFVASYDTRATLHDLLSGQVLTVGTETLRERYRDQFENQCRETLGRPCPDLRVTVIDTQTVGPYVMVKQSARIQRDLPPRELVVIYEVIDGKIRRAWYIRP